MVSGIHHHHCPFTGNYHDNRWFCNKTAESERSKNFIHHFRNLPGCRAWDLRINFHSLAIMGIIILITILAHLPAIIMAVVGASILKSKPIAGKVLLAFAGVYLIVGLGICGKILGKL